MKVVFMGTPEFALEVLTQLYSSKHEVVAVVCGTDKEAGRGKKVQLPLTKIFGIENDIPVFQFEKISRDGIDTLTNLNADVFVTAAFGQILSKEILDIAPFGTINVHGSLLPKYRGAAPVQYALLKGEKTTGVTIMQTDVGIDDGNIFLQKSLQINHDDTTESLLKRIAELGGKALVETLDLLEKGQITSTPQNHELATKTRMLKKEKSFINFEKDADSVVNFVRAYFPNPVAKFVYLNEYIKVLKAKVLNNVNFEKAKFTPGEIVVANPKQGLIISCGDDSFVEIEVLQAPSSKPMQAKSYLNGKKMQVGIVLGK
jgi:methionyl-tRNA formyltransferase